MTSHSIRDAGPVAPEISPASRLSLNREHSAGSCACKSDVWNTLPVSPLHSRLCECSVTSHSSKSHKANSLRQKDQKNTHRTSAGSTLFPILYPQSLESISMGGGITPHAMCFPGRKAAHYLAFLLASLLALTGLCL